MKGKSNGKAPVATSPKVSKGKVVAVADNAATAGVSASATGNGKRAKRLTKVARLATSGLKRSNDERRPKRQRPAKAEIQGQSEEPTVDLRLSFNFVSGPDKRRDLWKATIIVFIFAGSIFTAWSMIELVIGLGKLVFHR